MTHGVRRHELERAIRGLTESSGVIIYGPAGIGKSHLVDQLRVAAEATTPSHRILRFWGDDVEGPAFVADIDASIEQPHDRSEASGNSNSNRRGHEYEYEHGTGTRPIIIVEDLDLLPVAAAARVIALARDARVHLIGTIRQTVRREPPRWHALWKDGIVERIDLEPFNLLQTDEFVTDTLEGLSSAELARWAWALTGGNPRALHDLVDRARLAGNIVCREGVWLPVSVPEPGRPLRALVEERMAGLDEPTRDTVELIALGGSIPVDVVLSLTGAHPLDSAIASGLIGMSTGGPARRAVVEFANPVHASIVRAAVPPGRSRRLFEQLTDACDIAGAVDTDPGHFVDVALWSINVGATFDAGALLTAARCAEGLRRFDETITLTTRVLEDRDATIADRVDALVARGRSRRFLGNTQAAIVDLDEAIDLAHTEGDRSAAVFHRLLDATVERAHIDQFGHGDEMAARSRVTDLADEIPSDGDFDPIRHRLLADRALRLAYLGEFDEAAKIAASPEMMANVSAAIQAELVFTTLIAEVLKDPSPDALGAVEVVAAGLRAQDPAPPWALQFVTSVELVALLWRGDAAGAMQVIDAFETELSRSAFVDVAMWQIGRGLVEAALGRSEAALDDVRAGVARLELLDFSGWLVLGLTHRALLEAATGDVATASATLARARSLPARSSGIVSPYLRCCWARTEIAIGGDAAGIARSLIEGGQRQGMPLVEIWGWHTLGIAGDLDTSDETRERVRTLEDLIDSPLPRALARHVGALLDGDIDRTASATGEVMGMGYWIPPMNRSADKLTRRQLEIAGLAARGLTSRQIADQLCISRRTVETHLGNVFTALDVHNRAELAVVLAGTGRQA
ncbi:MAG: hypothetical protein JST73_02645 [Actinobacteria bacterium]|nr:hypothetical protein [Actinomycetota bacterium]